MKIDLDGPQLKEAVAAAVLQSLDEQKKGELITDAIKFLLTPEKGQYGRETVAPITEAFRQACHTLAFERCKELLKGEAELWAKLDAVIREAVDNALKGEQREKLVSNIQSAVVASFAPNY